MTYVKAYKRDGHYRPSPIRGALIEAHLQDYHDDLIEEMGRDPARYCGFGSTITNWILPVYPYMMESVMKPISIEDGDGNSDDEKIPTPFVLQILLVAFLSWLIVNSSIFFS